MKYNIQQMNILNSTIEIIPQQVQPVQHSELLLRLLVIVVVVAEVWVVDTGVGDRDGAPVATATEEDRGCGGFPVE